MTYEEENAKIAQEIEDIDRKIYELKKLKETISCERPQFLSYRYDNSELLSKRFIIEGQLRKIDERIMSLREFQKIKEDLLKESPTKRKMRNAVISTVEGLGLDKIPDPPRHVAGRVYEVSDGCFKWMLWFVIIGVLIIAICMS
ncbi:MAG: hypothetical protein K2I89_08935 [Muribaculaceae bacterium]|nr:hypothetical protein [Muribaculaceae bacterium]